jgi:hypothetical protein
MGKLNNTAFLFLASTCTVGIIVFLFLVNTNGFNTQAAITPMILVERPIGDSITFDLLSVSASDELASIEKDLQSTELRDLDDGLSGAEDTLASREE